MYRVLIKNFFNGINKDIDNILVSKHFWTILSRVNLLSPYQFIFIILEIIYKITLKGHFYWKNRKNYGFDIKKEN